MGFRYTAPRGMADFTSPRSDLMIYLSDVARDVLGLYGYQPINTPILESTELFVRSIGDGTDIVGKEMYTFEDQGGQSLTLRPEETAPVVRAYLERGLSSRGLPQKLYYIGPMFRRERPQAGRFRQFHQVGAEAIGSDSPAMDAEIIEISDMYFKRFGLDRYTLLINSIGCRGCRPRYVEDLVSYLEVVRGQLCDLCEKRITTNPLRVLDCKEPGCRGAIARAPGITSYLCHSCEEHFDRVLLELKALDIAFTVDTRLVRGLDYYTRTTFEFQFQEIGSQKTVSAGGRYDYLVEELGGPPTPGVGFSLGVERLIMVLEHRGKDEVGKERLDLFVAWVPGADRKFLLDLMRQARAKGIRADTDLMGRSLKSQMKHADRLQARLVIIMGPEEVERDEVVFRDLDGSRQWRVPLPDAVSEAVRLLSE